MVGGRVAISLFNAVGLIDIAMVGRLGAEAVAAVGYATQFFFLTQSVLFAVGFACVALMARAIGAGDGLRARHVLAASLAVAVVTALVLIVAVLAAPRELLELLGAEPAVVALAIPYLTMVVGASAILAISMTLESGMRATKDTRTPMQISLVAAVVKIALNGVLIFGDGTPRSEHPVVVRHPESGRKSLFIHGTAVRWLNGLPRGEGIALARYLAEHARTPEFSFRFRWEPHSIAFWDNRCCHHYAINDYFPHVRSGYRVQIEGHTPPAPA